MNTILQWTIRTTLAVSLFFNAVMFTVLTDNEDEIAKHKEHITWLEDDLATYKSSMIHWKEKCEHYQSANEALIKYSEPKSLNRAIKNTPLPQLKG